MISMSTVWDRATEFVGDNLGSLLPFALVIAGTVAAQDIAGQLGKAAVGAPAATLAASGIAFVISLVALFARFAITALAIDDRRSSSDAAALAAGRYLPALGVFLLLLVCVFALVLPMIIVLAANGVPVTQLRNIDPQAMKALPGWAVAFVLLYSLALVVVVLWLAARLALVIPVVLIEGKTLGAFRRSFGLTRGLALRILGVLVLIAIVGGVAVVAARAVFGTVFRLTLGDGGPLTPGPLITALLVALVSTVFTLIGDAFTGKLYVAARAAEDAAEPA